MSETVGTGDIIITADVSQLDGDLSKKLGKSAPKAGNEYGDKFGGGLKSTIAKLGLVALGAKIGKEFVGGIGSAISSASDLEQSVGGLEAIFDESFSKMDEQAQKAASTFGITRNAYNELATGLGATLKNSGLDDFAGKTQDLVGLGADLSAMYGGDATAAVGALGSLMRGETEPARKYGISINELAVKAELAAKGQDKRTGAELESAKAQARLDILFRQTADAQGAFARESDTLANKQQRASALWGEITTNIGQLFLPVISEAAGLVSDRMLPALESLTDGWVEKGFTDKIDNMKLGLEGFKDLLVSGDYTSALSEAFNIEEDSPIVGIVLSIREGLSEALGYVKEFSKGFLSEFGGLGGLGDTLLPLLSGLNIPFAILRDVLLDLVKSVDFEAFGATIGSVLSQLAGSLGSIITVVVEAGSTLVTTLLPVIGNLIQTLMPVLIDLFNQLVPVIVSVIDAVVPLVTQLVEALAPVFADLIQTLLPPIIGLIADLAPVIMEVLSAVVPLVSEILSALVPAIADLIKAIAPLIATFIDSLVPVIMNIVDAVLPVLMSAFEMVSTLLSTVIIPIFTAVVDFLAGTFTDAFNNLQPVIDIVFSFIQRTVENVMGVVQGIIDVVMGAIEGDWSRVWDGIKSVASSIWDQIKNIIDTAVNLVKEYITAFITQVGDAWDNFWESFKGIGEDAWNWISDTALSVWDTLSEKTEAAFNGIKDVVEDVWNGIKIVVGTPINAVIGFINDGIIDGYNKLADTLSLSRLSPIPSLAGFATGGYVNLPWSAANRDPYLGMTRDRKMFRFEGEEFIVNREQTRKYRHLLELINSGKFDPHGLPGLAGGGLVNFRGHRFTGVFAALLRQAEQMAGQAMHISQGGFRPRTSYSGTSHQGDAVDLTGANHRSFIPFLRQLGIPTWDRTGKGNWVSHSHGVPLPGSGRAAGSAIWQAQDYLRGGDGLGGRDNGPRGGAISSFIKGIGDALQNGFQSVSEWFGSIGEGVRGMFDGLSLGDNMFGRLLSGISRKLMDGFGDWLLDALNPFDDSAEEKLGKGYARGTDWATPGLHLVGERGPELVDFRGGERVYSAAVTSAMTQQLTARLDPADIDRLARAIVGMAQATSSRTVDSAFLALGRGV